MHIIFDLNGTVFGSNDLSLRPGIKETIEALRENGCKVDFWTGGPVEYYASLLRERGIAGGVYAKSGSLPFEPDICVDDEPEGWMPGRVIRVKSHISGCEPGNSIMCSDLLYGKETDVFYWD